VLSGGGLACAWRKASEVRREELSRAAGMRCSGEPGQGRVAWDKAVDVVACWAMGGNQAEALTRGAGRL
jgi:hypothetical protein